MKSNNSIYIGILLLSLNACSSDQKPTQTESPAKAEVVSRIEFTQQQIENLGIKTDSTRMMSLQETILLSGKIELPPKNLHTITSALGGLIRTIEVVEGMPVSKGQLLFTLEDEKYITLQQDYLLSKNQLGIKLKELNRQKELFSQKAATEKALELAQNEYLNQQTDYFAASEKLKLIGIQPGKVEPGNISRKISCYAPAQGYVKKVFLNTGSYAASGAVILEILDPSAMILNITAFEKDLRVLQKGVSFSASTNHLPEKKYPGKIEYISPALDQDHSVQAFGRFEKMDANLKPGMFMNVSIIAKNQNKTVLPEKAIIDFEGSDHIFRETGEHSFELIKVKTGMVHKGFIEIETGLNTGDRVITEGAYNAYMAWQNGK